jgi:hypothetical protein
METEGIMAGETRNLDAGHRVIRIGVDGDANAAFEAAFATLREAAEQSDFADARIELGDGLYRLKETVVISRKTLGRFRSRLEIAAAIGAKPVIAGSLPLEGWRLAEAKELRPEVVGKVWVADLPQHLAFPKTLYDDHGMLPRSRSRGFVPPDTGTEDAFSFPEGILPSPITAHGLELSVRPSFLWCHNILPIASLDREKRTARTTIPATYAIRPVSAWESDLDESAWFENHPRLIRGPGEWAVDPEARKLYLWPRDGGPPANIRAGRLTELLRIEGNEEQGEPLCGIELRGLTFTESERDSIGQEDRGLQHDWDFQDKGNAMLRLRWVKDAAVRDCRFLCGGSSGIRADQYAQGVRVEGNHFRELGGGGVLFCGYGPGTMDVNKDNAITDNLIEDCGRLIWHSPGIHLWQSGGNLVSGNLIRDLPYTGIIVSGSHPQFFQKGDHPRRELERTVRWQEVGDGPFSIASIQPFLHSRNNQLIGNEITRVVQKLGDGNGIYIRFSSETGNQIRGNHVSDIRQMHNAGGIRCDDEQCGVLVEGNIISCVQHAGICLSGRNTLLNNFIVDVLNDGNCHDVPAPFFRGYLIIWNVGSEGSRIERNVFLDTGRGKPDFFFLTHATYICDQSPELRAMPMKNNLYHVAGNPGWAADFVSRTLAEGIGPGSLAIDPDFRAGSDGRFELDTDILSRLGIESPVWPALGRARMLAGEETREDMK